MQPGSLISSNGFPKTIGLMNDKLIPLIEEVGDNLSARQDDIVAVYEGRKGATEKVYVRNKPDGSYVTSEDDWANGELEKKLREMSPDGDKIGIVLEESGHQRKLEEIKKPVVWLGDPLDNTSNYIRGGNNWSVSIGCMENGNPTGGIVYYPKWGLLFYTGDDGKAHIRTRDGSRDEVLQGSTTKKHDDIINRGLTVGISGQMEKLLNVLHIRGTEVSPEYIGIDHSKRYWSLAMPETQAKSFGLPDGSYLEGGADVALYGAIFDKWDFLAVDAICSRCGVVSHDGHGHKIDYRATPPEAPFKISSAGFMAGNEGTLQAIGTQRLGLLTGEPYTAGRAVDRIRRDTGEQGLL